MKEETENRELVSDSSNKTTKLNKYFRWREVWKRLLGKMRKKKRGKKKRLLQIIKGSRLRIKRIWGIFWWRREERAEEAGLKKASKEKEKAEVQEAGAGAAVAGKIAEAADEVGAGAGVGSRREEMGSGRNWKLKFRSWNLNMLLKLKVEVWGWNMIRIFVRSKTWY